MIAFPGVDGAVIVDPVRAIRGIGIGDLAIDADHKQIRPFHRVKRERRVGQFELQRPHSRGDRRRRVAAAGGGDQGETGQKGTPGKTSLPAGA